MGWGGGCPCNRPSRAPHFLDSRLTDGGEVVSPSHRSPFSPKKISRYSFLSEASRDLPACRVNAPKLILVQSDESDGCATPFRRGIQLPSSQFRSTRHFGIRIYATLMISNMIFVSSSLISFVHVGDIVCISCCANVLFCANARGIKKGRLVLTFRLK
jgi:hypothetical protein